MWRAVLVIVVVITGPGLCLADDVLYRYEGNVLPYDPSAGWLDGLCDYPCSESLEQGHFVLRWPEAGELASYHYWIARQSQEPPASLWVEWRFRSNHPIPPHSYTCDAYFNLQYADVSDMIFIYGDAVVSFSGSDFVWGLPNGEFRTYRFESPDGVNYWFSVDGLVFRVSRNKGGLGSSFLQFGGGGGCIDDQIPDMVNEWDFVRFGTMGSGERLVGSDPPGGFVDARHNAPLDHFTITFDAPNYVYLNEISVETTSGDAPEVTRTRRLEDGAPETVEIVLDRPIPFGATTRFTFDDGEAINVVEYTFAPGDTDGDGDADLRDAAAFQCCFGQAEPVGLCLALDANADGTIDLDDYAFWFDALAANP